MTSYCPHCGTPGPDEARFCMKCGRDRRAFPAALHAEARLTRAWSSEGRAVGRHGTLRQPTNSDRYAQESGK
ncbi:zinc ribbon domain-containing protein, partial [Streptomyces scabiei]|uniref:zinc ribbon domain-containing protein n=1 Tax=Streptomyces scabiei TaxID=1930 RepID=UPI0038D459FD